MKTQLSILAFLVFSLNQAFAQRFTVPNDTIKESVYDSKTMYNNITNTSVDSIKITWKVIAHDFPESWGRDFAICDNLNCYYNLNNSLLDGSPYTSSPILPGTKGNFYVLLDLTTADNGKHFVTIQMTDGITPVNATWVITRLSTGLTMIQKNADNILLYPVPCNNNLTFKYDEKDKDLQVEVYNALGMQVLQQNQVESGSPVDVSKLPKGLYFIKFIGKDWFSSKPFTKE